MPNKLVVIVDFDGTLCDITHRLHYIQEGNSKDWNGFFEACDEDKPKQDVIDLVNTLYNSGKYLIYIFSGRSDIVYEKSRKWLSDYGVKYHSIRFRKNGNYIPDIELKEAWLMSVKVKNVAFVIDDRDRVVAMWRSHGLTALQVAPGDF